jgi:hypothetical protein
MQVRIQEFLVELQRLMVQVQVNEYTFKELILMLLVLFTLSPLQMIRICILQVNEMGHRNQPLIWHEYLNVHQFILMSMLKLL